MNITDGALLTQAARARATWPWIDQVEAEHRLPRCLLYAVGSRETGLTMVTGDGGHGHGVWQLDDRSHTIPPGFDTDPYLQAEVAAAMLGALLAGGTAHLVDALNRYNSGQPATAGTAGGDYGPETAERMTWLQRHFEPPYVEPLFVPTQGAEVALWQDQMQWRGWKVAGRVLAVDGVYGPLSNACCTLFQQQHGLTVDGIVGPVTWAATWSLPPF